jgi:hypothetical protein
MVATWVWVMMKGGREMVWLVIIAGLVWVLEMVMWWLGIENWVCG